MTSPAVIRAAMQSDLAAIRSILEEWVVDPATGEPLATDIDAHVLHVAAAVRGERSESEFVVAERDEVVGVCGLQWSGLSQELVEPDESAAEVVGAYVRRVARGSGVGQALLDDVERRARERGFETILVVSGSRNREHGYPFWQKRYGEPVRWDEDYFGPGAERVVWRHELRGPESALSPDSPARSDPSEGL